MPDDNPDKKLRFPVFKHPLFCLLGFRGVISQHSEKENKTLKKYAFSKKCIVEIGVSEGVSAYALLTVAAPYSEIYLIDPYLPGRIPFINLTKVIARKYINSCISPTKVHWIQLYSYEASKSWNKSIDFLFIDGDHSYEACLRDWNEWSPFICENGIVAFHDARILKDGWTSVDWGPVKVVDQLFRNQNNTIWKILDEVDSLVILKKNI